MNAVRVNAKAAGRVASGHPWIFLSDIVDHSTASPGEAVAVMDPRNRVIGVAHFSSTSQIALRLLTTNREPADRTYYMRRLTAAIEHRRKIVDNSNAYRLVFTEGDQLPGLIVDRYGDYLVVQMLTQGMDRAKDLIISCLEELLQPKGILARNDANVRKLEGLPQEVVTLAGEIPERVPVSMNGLTLTADLQRGQKTGVYLDQRENYVAASRFAHGRVLDVFSSTGGFALHMARRAESVETVESSTLAIDTARANASANGIGNIEFREADAFNYLSGLDRRFSTIVLDPPAFAKSRKQLDDAARGYKEINFRALRLLDAGGILITCSCSHHISEAMFLEVIAQAALDARKTVRVLDRRSQAADHPILLTVPETLYLKCLILEILDR